MNYSYETSYPPFLENQAINKKTQCDEVLAFIIKGANNLLQLAQLTGIDQSTVSARVNNLIEDGKIEYKSFTAYPGADGKLRKRKKIVAIKKLPEGTQSEMFN